MLDWLDYLRIASTIIFGIVALALVMGALFSVVVIPDILRDISKSLQVIADHWRQGRG